jgi:hypothetical protein
MEMASASPMLTVTPGGRWSKMEGDQAAVEGQKAMELRLASMACGVNV